MYVNNSSTIVFQGWDASVLLASQALQSCYPKGTWLGGLAMYAE